ncbi:MAG: hypothetical protein ACLFRY_03165 [Spirochaetia bacterium]
MAKKVMNRERTVILDCSISASWCFADENDAYTTAVLDSFTEEYITLLDACRLYGLTTYDAVYLVSAL